jgi:hypothetical protein
LKEIKEGVKEVKSINEDFSADSEKIIKLDSELKYVVPAKGDKVDFDIFVKELDNLFATCKTRIRFLGWGKERKKNLLNNFNFKFKFVASDKTTKLNNKKNFKEIADFLVLEIKKIMEYYSKYFNSSTEKEKINKKIQNINKYIEEQLGEEKNLVKKIENISESSSQSTFFEDKIYIEIYNNSLKAYNSLVEEFRKKFKERKEEIKSDRDSKMLKIRVKKMYSVVLECSIKVNDILEDFEETDIYKKYGNEIAEIQSQVNKFCSEFKKEYTRAKTFLVYSSVNGSNNETILEIKNFINQFRDKIYYFYSCCLKLYLERARMERARNLIAETKNVGYYKKLIEDFEIGKNSINNKLSGKMIMHDLEEKSLKEINALREMSREFELLLKYPSGARTMYRKWRMFLKIVAMKYMPLMSQFAMILGMMTAPKTSAVNK